MSSAKRALSKTEKDMSKTKKDKGYESRNPERMAL